MDTKEKDWYGDHPCSCGAMGLHDCPNATGPECSMCGAKPPGAVVPDDVRAQILQKAREQAFLFLSDHCPSSIVQDKDAKWTKLLIDSLAEWYVSMQCCATEWQEMWLKEARRNAVARSILEPMKVDDDEVHSLLSKHE